MTYVRPHERLSADALSDVDTEYPVSERDVDQGCVEDAGPDRRPLSAHARVGFRIWAAARKQYARSVAFSSKDPGSSRADLGKALDLIASASYWLEDSNYLNDIHVDMHVMGRFQRERYQVQCSVEEESGSFQVKCPIAIAHKRFGFSVAMKARTYLCSLCGEAYASCSHLPGRLYRVRGGAEGSPTERCRVCSGDGCQHRSDTTYVTTQSGVVVEAELHEVSIVDRPKSPDARLGAIPVNAAWVRSRLGQPSRGVTLFCDQCVDRCPGFTYLDSRSGAEGQS